MRHLKKRPEVLKNKKSFSQQLEEANTFFNVKTATPAANYMAGDNPYADKDGLVEFVVATELIDNAEVMKELSNQKKDLIAIASIVTDKVYDLAKERGIPKTDPELWDEVMSYVPLIGVSSVKEEVYSKKTKGTSIASDFVELIMDVVASQGTSAMGDFNSFLEKQGDEINLGMKESSDSSYNSMSLGVSLEAFMLGNEVVYTPKIQQYEIIFDRKNSSFTTACSSSKNVSIHFQYRYAVAVFDYEALEDPEVAELFYEFINGARKAQIEEATTYFESIFPVEN